MKIKSFLKSEAVLVISFLLALASSFFVAPGKEYLSYIDFRTLALLFCLMAVVAGFNSLGFFSRLAQTLLRRAGSVRSLCLTLTLLAFFLSMIFTNDVSLITLVPFSIVVLDMLKKDEALIPLVSLETVAANLGSMATPIGNPQNLYLFSFFDMSPLSFFSAILPFSALSLLFLAAFTLFSPSLPNEKIEFSPKTESFTPSLRLTALYIILFLLAIFAVFRLIFWQAAFLITVPLIAVFDRKIFKKIDFSLLLTFVFLFIFIGNLGHIAPVRAFLEAAVSGHEVIVGVLSSQIFSNVPAAILLSGFTKNAPALLVGVNLGGLGTLIASMASLISFKFIANKEKVNTAKYISAFTFYNIIFLLANLALWLILKAFL